MTLFSRMTYASRNRGTLCVDSTVPFANRETTLLFTLALAALLALERA